MSLNLLATLANAALCTLGLRGSKGTLLTHFHLVTHQCQMTLKTGLSSVLGVYPLSILCFSLQSISKGHKVTN